MRNTALILVAAATVLTGCATVASQRIDQNAASALKDQTIAQTTRAKRDFAAITAAKVMVPFGLGLVAAVSDGNNIIATNKVADPADRMATELVEMMRARYGAKPAQMPAASVTGTEAAEVAAAAKGAGKYVLDVQTTDWAMTYFPTAYSRYRVIYSAKARLIDTASAAVVAQGSCRRAPEDSTNAPGYDEMVANDAALLKKELALAAAACVDSLKTEMLAL